MSLAYIKDWIVGASVILKPPSSHMLAPSLEQSATSSMLNGATLATIIYV